VDLAGCFGNTTMATLNGMDYDAIRENWKDADTASTVSERRRFPARVTGIDISANALAYGKSAGIYDNTIQADLNTPDANTKAQLDDAIKDADVLISTAALVYLEPDAVENIMDAFAANNSEGLPAGQLPEPLRTGSGGCDQAHPAGTVRVCGQHGVTPSPDVGAGALQLPG